MHRPSRESQYRAGHPEHTGFGRASLDCIPEGSSLCALPLAGKLAIRSSPEICLTQDTQASKEDHELSSELFENLPLWLNEGKVRPNKPKVLKGLGAVTQGFQEYRDGAISAYKIVYEL